MSARFPHSRNPLCELPRDDSLEARMTAARETLDSTCELLRLVSLTAEDENRPVFEGLNVALWAISHVQQLLESQNSTA